MLHFIDNWSWLAGLASGALFLLVAYKVIPWGHDEEWHRRNRKLLKVCGLACILGSIGMLILQRP